MRREIERASGLGAECYEGELRLPGRAERVRDFCVTFLTHLSALMGIQLQRAPVVAEVCRGLQGALRAWGARGRVFESLRPDQ